MLKKTIKHKDLDGNDVETDAYFNLTKAEAIELNIRNDLEVIGRSRNNNEIMDTFRRIMQLSYGVRTSTGGFRKEGFADFAASEAYSELFMELWTDPTYAQEFITAILPKDIGVTPAVPVRTDLPAHLSNLPSMQGHRPKAEPPRAQQSQPDVKPAITSNDEYQEFLAFKAARDSAATLPPERVSSPEDEPKAKIDPLWNELT